MLFVRCSLPLVRASDCCRLFASCPKGALELGCGSASLDEVMACETPGLQALCVASADQVPSFRCSSFLQPDQMGQVASRMRKEAERLSREHVDCHCFCWSFNNTRLLVALHPAGESLLAFTDPQQPCMTHDLVARFLGSK